MKRLRILGLLLSAALLSGLVGCDVALVAVLASRNKSNSKSSNAAAAPDVSFKLWVAELGAVTGAAEQLTLQGNHGDPDAKWTLLASPTSSGEYTMPTPTAGGFDAILVQATVNQVYEIDAFEIIDATGTTIATPATVFGGNVSVAGLGPAQGPPDGVGAITAATSTDRAFIFMKHSSPITTFRVSLWGQGMPRVTGDTQWATTYALPGTNQVVGGADINSQGMIYASLKEGSSFLMIRFSSDGVVVQDANPSDFTSLETGVSAAVGSASIVIDKSNDDVFVATTRLAGDIRIQKFVGIGQANTWQNTVLMGAGVDRVERNGLALNSAKELILAGGLDGGGLGGGVNHYIKKLSNSSSFTDLWATASPSGPPTPSDLANTYWYAVATDGTQDIFTAGDLNSLIVLGTPDAYTTRILDTNTPSFNGSVTETWSSHSQGEGTGAPPARGVSIGIDGSHNVYVAGFTTGSGLDSFVIKYTGGNATPGPHVASTRAGNDEFLDVAVDTDGTSYATGYETNSAQEDLVLFKFAPNGGVLWKRTLNFNNNADRGVQVLMTATHVIVVGQVTNTGGDLDIHVRKYVK